MDRKRMGQTLRALLGISLLLPLVPPHALAGTAGKLSGSVVDKKKQPLAGANVVVPAARLGAATDGDGRYAILNLPAGTYEVKISLLGHQPVMVQNVRISADNTTKLDAELQESPLEMEEVVVAARRPVVDITLTSTLATVSRQEIASLPVQELNDVVNLQAGVVEGHFRGGRLGEVQYQVDGVTVNNVYDNKASLRLDRSLLEEVQVISGTFDAEYGQAMSGVINAVLRRGTEKFTWDAEVISGGFVYPGSDRLVEFRLRPAGVQNYQFSVSGPTPFAKTFYLLNARRYAFDDWVYGTRRFVPNDSSDFANKVFRPTGHGNTVPLGNTREWSGVAKLTNRSLANIELNYQAVLDQVEGQRTNYQFRLDPDGLSKQRSFSIVHGFDWTHTLSGKAFYNVSLRQNYLRYRDMVYDDLNDPRYDDAGPPTGDAGYELGAYVQGVDFTRFEQTTNTFVGKASFISQFTRDQQIKAGGELQLPKVEFGSPGYLVYSTVGGRQTLVRHDEEPPNFPGVLTYWPVIGAAFAQDEVEWNDLRIRAGARLEYFDARSTLPSDLANPANSIQGAPRSVQVPTTPKLSVAPRLGVSYPITPKSSLFFAYGHFYQMPGLGQVFSNADYSILSGLQAAGISYGIMGNPDIRPERTVQYQFGYKQALSEWLGLDVNAFYKDVRNLLGTEFVSTYNGAEYARLTNVDFGSVIGFTITLDQRPRGLIGTTVDYTWQLAQGNSSDPRETATRASAGEDPRPRQVPFNWDQRHTLILTVIASRPNDFTLSTILRAASGQPYTPTVQTGFAGGLETNSGRKPLSVVLDLRGEKAMEFAGNNLSAFARVFNVLDARFFNGFVFSSSGSPYYSRFSTGDQVVLADPGRYYPPRRIEVGLSMRMP